MSSVMLSTNCLLGGRLASGRLVASADFVFAVVGFFGAGFFCGFVCFADGFFVVAFLATGFFFVGMILLSSNLFLAIGSSTKSVSLCS